MEFFDKTLANSHSKQLSIAKQFGEIRENAILNFGVIR
jgi:hypothetical protein